MGLLIILGIIGIYIYLKNRKQDKEQAKWDARQARPRRNIPNNIDHTTQDFEIPTFRVHTPI